MPEPKRIVCAMLALVAAPIGPICNSERGFPIKGLATAQPFSDRTSQAPAFGVWESDDGAGSIIEREPGRAQTAKLTTRRSEHSRCKACRNNRQGKGTAGGFPAPGGSGGRGVRANPFSWMPDETEKNGPQLPDR